MENGIVKKEQLHSFQGLPIRFANVAVYNGIIRNQKATAVREFKENGKKKRIQVTLRFDDECKNGHETFSITADVFDAVTGRECGGCMHEEIKKHFPELAHLIKWHLMSTDGPMHYLANTLYLAGARDHNGLLSGEFRPFKDKNGKVNFKPFAAGTPKHDWCEKYIRNGTLYPLQMCTEYLNQQTNSPELPEIVWLPDGRTGEGKAPEFEAARRAAIWPNATDEQLSKPQELLKTELEQRLPNLISEFESDMRSVGFVYGGSK